MAYTFKQIYDLAMTLWDKAGSPYLTKPDFDRVASMKYNDFVTSQIKILEDDQESTIHIQGLYRPYSVTNTATINTSTDTPNFRYLLRMRAKYRKECNGTITYPQVSVRKAPNNNVDLMEADPFNKGVDADPYYVPEATSGVPVYRVVSENTPLEISGQYVRTPSKIDVTNNPNTVFELSDVVAEAIAKAVVLRSDVMIENLQRAQAEAQIAS